MFSSHNSFVLLPLILILFLFHSSLIFLLLISLINHSFFLSFCIFTSCCFYYVHKILVVLFFICPVRSRISLLFPFYLPYVFVYIINSFFHYFSSFVYPNNSSFYSPSAFMLSYSFILLFILCIIFSFYSHHPFMSPVPPSAPSAHISDATSSSLTVSWAAGDTGGAAVRAWAVWWRAAQGGGSWHTRDLGRAHSRFVISDLQCGAEYQVRTRW